jgi:hypothetical protein
MTEKDPQAPLVVRYDSLDALPPAGGSHILDKQLCGRHSVDLLNHIVCDEISIFVLQ